MTSKDVSLIDMETGKELKLLSGSINEISFLDQDIPPINVHNTYSFQCDVKLSGDIRKLFEGNPAWKTARRLADELNDLVEEYHAPGTPRRERRAIQREFDKVFRIFRKHCQTNMIDFKFVRT